MHTKLKVGVAGVGSLGQWHARIYSELPEVELAGVFDADPRRAQEIAERYRTRAFASLPELAGAVEAASVVVPTNRHAEVTDLFMNKGVHLLVEKPIATTQAEAEHMVATAAERNLVLQIGHVERFNPAIDELPGLLKTPHYIEAARMAPYPPPRPGLPPRGTEVSVVHDLMIHDLEIILHLVASPIVSVQADGFTCLSPTEDFASARLRFANGCVARVTASRISQERVRQWTIFQADNYLTVDFQAQAARIVRKTATGLEAQDLPTVKAEPLKRELASFVDCVRRRGTPVVDGHQGTAALRLADEVCLAIRGNNR